MSNYSKVQFISWELNTGPFIAQHGPYQIGWYAGLLDPSPDKRTDALGQCRDIAARLAFVRDAIIRAEAVSDRSAATLKLFMAPEFLFRGAGGAYLHDLISGWTTNASMELRLPAPYNGPWSGLFGGLRAVVADARFEDWVFVFGTAVSAAFPTARQNGKFVLDPGLPGEIYNTALVQRGGAQHALDNYVTRKQYISGIDFLRWNANIGQHTANTVLPLDPRGLVPDEALGISEGGALFQVPGINDGAGKPIGFGLEICLDHARSGGNGRNHYGRIRSAGGLVKIQLVPSGGMALVPESIRLQPPAGTQPTSYAFNCDGLGTLDGHAGSHTQLWSAGGAAVPQRVVEASSGAPHDGTVLVAPAAELQVGPELVRADMLWNNGSGVAGAGKVRIVATRDL